MSNHLLILRPRLRRHEYIPTGALCSGGLEVVLSSSFLHLSSGLLSSPYPASVSVTIIR
jgi:hypothetical protein